MVKKSVKSGKAKQVALFGVATISMFSLQASWAQSASDSTAPAQQIEKVEVTGSNIRSTDAATTNNVQTLTAADIQQTGRETVADVLHALSSNFASYNETFSNSFSPGASGAALRGLSEKNTLVLLDGQRMVNYGFAQNLEDTYVDLNTIPANAVDHIDILKNGGGAVYGSDAIAGVINIVLKHDSQDKIVDIGYGAGPSGREGTADSSVTLGFGDLETDGWNAMIAASYFHRNELKQSEVPYYAGGDYRNQPGGVLAGIVTGNAYISDADPTAPQSPFASCGKNGQPGSPTSLTLFPTSAVGSFCGYNGGNQTDLIPGTERSNLVANGTFKISPTLTAFGDIFASNSQTFVTGTPAQLSQTAVAYDGATGGVSLVPNTLPVGNPSNPGATPQDIIYTFQSVGPGDYIVRSNTARLSGGLKGTIGTWDWDATVGYAENDVVQTNYNAINVSALENEIANGSFNFLYPNSTPAANNALRTSFSSPSVSKLETVTLKASGDLYTLPAGTIEGALGYEYRHESIDETPDPQITAGQILGYGTTAVNGARDVNAIFGEVNIPIFKTLDGDIAVREEQYSDAGANFSPKFSLRYQPFDEITLRASYSKGFRAPSLPEISNASATAFEGISDPNDPLGRPSETTAIVIKANPNLTPETSDNTDIGIIFAPTHDMSMSLDFYKIDVFNAVAAETTAQNIVDDPTAYPGQVVRTPAGLLDYVVIPYANIYHIETQGLDFDIRNTWHLPADQKLTLDFTGTYVDRLGVNNGPGGNPVQNYAGTDGWLIFSPIGGGGPVPRLRDTLSAVWENHDWVARTAVNYSSGYTEVLCALEVGYCGGATPQAEGAAANVASFTTVDLYAEYRGIKHWRIYGSVLNLLNRRPPFDAYDYPYDVTLGDPTGRFASIHAEYKF